MNKEELKAKLHNYEERLKDVAKAIKETRAQLAEAEKPKLRHGDFGITDSPYIVVSQPTCISGSPKAIYANGGGQDNADKVMSSDSRLGNVFDLMKGWDKPFEEYGTDEYATGIKIEDNGTIRIYACTGDCKKEKCYCSYFLDEAEDFYNALGHAIAELKQSKEISGEKIERKL